MSAALSPPQKRPMPQALAVTPVFPDHEDRLLGSAKLPVGLLLLSLSSLMLSACAASLPDKLCTPIEGYSHTSAAINRFTVNGGGGPNIGPHNGGGAQAGCAMLPRHWQPGLKVLVEWEKDPTPHASMNWPLPMFSDAWNAAAELDAKSNTQHSAMVEVAPYERLGIINVHFLPCDRVKVAAVYIVPGQPGYPYNESLNMEEPSLCPQP